MFPYLLLLSHKTASNFNFKLIDSKVHNGPLTDEGLQNILKLLRGVRCNRIDRLRGFS